MKKYTLLFFIGLFIMSTANAQSSDNVKTSTIDYLPSETENIDTSKIYENGELTEQAKPPTNWLSVIKHNIKYTDEAKYNEIQGRVVLLFTIERDGSISDVITEGKRLGFGLEEESKRVLRLLGNFTPAKINGIPVKTKYRIPIQFSSN